MAKNPIFCPIFVFACKGRERVLGKKNKGTKIVQLANWVYSNLCEFDGCGRFVRIKGEETDDVEHFKRSFWELYNHNNRDRGRYIGTDEVAKFLQEQEEKE